MSAPLNPTGGRAEPSVLLYANAVADDVERSLRVSEAVRQEFPLAAVHVARTGGGSDAARDLEPDFVVVDDLLAGCDARVLEEVRALRTRKPGSRLVIGLRDILGDRGEVREWLHRSGAYGALERTYDELWIYGVPEVYDTVREYGFPEAVAARSRFCGYLRTESGGGARTVGPPEVLVAADGIGPEVVETYIQGLVTPRTRPGLLTHVAFGTSTPQAVRRELRSRFRRDPAIRFHEPDPRQAQELWEQAEVVICGASYAAVCRLFAFGRRAVLVPGDDAGPDAAVRARRLAELELAQALLPGSLKPDVLMGTVLDALDSAPRPWDSIDLGGLARVRERVRALLS